MAETPSELSMRQQAAAHSRWAKETDRSAATEPARRGLLDRFEREVDPEGRLTPTERQRRAESARRAFYVRMALKSAQARRKKRAA